MSNELGDEQAETEPNMTMEKPAQGLGDQDLQLPGKSAPTEGLAPQEARGIDEQRPVEPLADQLDVSDQPEEDKADKGPVNLPAGPTKADNSFTYFELRVEERPVEKKDQPTRDLGQETLSTPEPSAEPAETLPESAEPVEVDSSDQNNAQVETAANSLEAFTQPSPSESIEGRSDQGLEIGPAEDKSVKQIIGIENDDEADDEADGEDEAEIETGDTGEAETEEEGDEEIIIPGGEDDDELLRDVLAQLTTRISILGSGGAGNNTVHRLIDLGVEGATVIALNTDAQHLLVTQAQRKILLGRNLTKGLGAGSLPRLGEGAAEESRRLVAKAIDGADIVFLTCGLGGGTGTGSTPILTQVAKEIGALTIAIVTLPFKTEGAIRMANALQGLTKLREAADTVIVIPNDKLLEVAPLLPLNQAFAMADEVLGRAIKCMTDITTKPGLINIDFADLRTIMRSGGVAMVGIGESAAEDRAVRAVEEALSSPLLSVDISGAQGALVYVVGGPDMTLQEAEQVLKVVQGKINKEARIIWGASVDKSLEQKLRVMLVVTGVQSPQILGPMHRPEQELENRYGIDFVQ